MDDLIEQLNELAAEILTAATELSDGIADGKTPEIGRAQQLLKSLCDKLGKVHELLARPKSPLAELVRRVAGTQLSVGLTRAEQFLDEHHQTLRKLGVKSAYVDQVMTSLRELVGPAGDASLDKPQDIEASPVLAAIAEFRDLVCFLSSITEFADQVLNVKVLKAVADGVAGTALVVVDVTGAAAVAPHDLTGWVLVKAVKSTWSGVAMIRRSFGSIKEAVNSLTFLRNEQALRDAKSKKPPPRLPPSGADPKG